MHNDLQVNQLALIINTTNTKYQDMIGRSVMVKRLMSIEESIDFFWFNDLLIREPYAIIDFQGKDAGIKQRYLMPIPPLDDQTEIESKLILTPEKEKCLQ